MSNRNLDEYKPVKFYADNTTAKQSGFSKFKDGDDYYFCRYIDGDIALLSQAYTSSAGRDIGIKSVKKNEKLAKRFVFETRQGNKHGFALKAGNGQEIAISPDYASRGQAERISGRMTGRTKATAAPKKAAPTSTPSAKAAFTSSDSRIENYKPLSFYETHGGRADGFNSFENNGASYFHYNQGGKIVLISESYTSAAGRDNGIASVKKNLKRAAAYQQHQHKNGKYYFDLNAGNHQEIATSRWYSNKSGAAQGAMNLQGGTLKPRAGNNEDEYMPVAFYKKATKGKQEGFESFKGENGEHYFTYFENGKIALISEGYPTAAVRDKGLASVEKNMKTEARYVFGKDKGADGKEGFVLRAGNNKEIARSVGYGSAAGALAGAAYLMGARRRVAPQANATVKKTTVKKAAVPVKAAAIKPKPAANPAPVAAPIAAGALGAAAVAGTAGMAAKPKAVAPVAAAPAVVTTDGGGIGGWLKWLLLALLALFAMFFLFKACAGGAKDIKALPVATTAETAAPAAMITCWNGSKAKNNQSCPTKITCWDDSFATRQSACPAKPAPTPAATAIESPAPKVSVANTTSAPIKITESSVDGRICAPSSSVLFNVSSLSPKSVSVLGTNPQFGNSLSLTPDAFYRKLVAAAQTNQSDRAFLNLLARDLGYGSFADMDASMFSNDSLANGTSGLLGFGSQHALQYSTLNVTDPTHLEAFKVRSSNGTDVHFMKRCGNFMYVCQP